MDNSIFDKLPNHLHLARNSNAEHWDRWRIFNTVTNKSIKETGSATIEECMMKLIALEKTG